MKMAQPNRKGRVFKMILPFLFPLIVLAACLSFTGCEGTESRDAVKDTVEELAGKKKLDQMEQMKRRIGAINQQQSDRLKEPDQ